MGYNKQWENYTEKYQKLCMENDVIPDSLFKEYGVNRGLRDINGNGVLTGLTNISRIDSFWKDCLSSALWKSADSRRRKGI